MDMAAGIAIGFAIGIGAGMASGQKDIGKRITEHVQREGLIITTPDGKPYPIEQLIKAGQTTACAGPSRRVAIISVFIIILALVAVGVLVYFSTRG